MQILRRLRGALGNALVWAAAWFGAGFLFITAINVLQLGFFRHYVGFSLSHALEYAATMAVVGFVTGGAFSLYVATAFRDKRLEDLRPARLALGGGLVAVLLSLGVIGVFTGFDVLFLRDLIWPVLLPAVLGSVTGYGSIKLAQRPLLEGSTVGELSSDSERGGEAV